MRLAQGNDVMVRFILTEEERTLATDEVPDRCPMPSILQPKISEVVHVTMT